MKEFKFKNKYTRQEVEIITDGDIYQAEQLLLKCVTNKKHWVLIR